MDPQRHAGLSIIEQYARRRQEARNSWALHMLIGAVPFCAFVWGPRALAIPAWLAFAACLIHGFYRQVRIDRCPACNASRYQWFVAGLGVRAFRSDEPSCESCRATLIAE